MKLARVVFVIAGLALVLAVTNNSIRTHQQIVDSDQQVLLELRPVDPRSLIQGDFMSLAYADSVFPPAWIQSELPNRGTFVISVEDDGVGTYSRIDDGSALASDELRLRFRKLGRHRHPSLGAESFYFEEGQAEFFANARYGVLRVDEAGRSVLVGLADANLELMVPPRDEQTLAQP